MSDRDERQINRKLDALMESLAWLIANDENRDYDPRRRDARHPDPLIVAFREGYQSLENRIADLMTDLTKIRAAVEAAVAKLDSLESTVATSNAKIEELSAAQAALTQQVTDLTAQVAAGSTSPQEQADLDALADSLSTRAAQ